MPPSNVGSLQEEPEQALIVEPEEAEPLVEVEVEAEPARDEAEAPEPGEPPRWKFPSLPRAQPGRSVPAEARSLALPREAPPRADRV